MESVAVDDRSRSVENLGIRSDQAPGRQISRSKSGGQQAANQGQAMGQIRDSKSGRQIGDRPRLRSRGVVPIPISMAEGG